MTLLNLRICFSSFSLKTREKKFFLIPTLNLSCRSKAQFLLFSLLFPSCLVFSLFRLRWNSVSDEYLLWDGSLTFKQSCPLYPSPLDRSPWMLIVMFPTLCGPHFFFTELSNLYALSLLSKKHSGNLSICFSSYILQPRWRKTEFGDWLGQGMTSHTSSLSEQLMSSPFIV